GKHCTIKICRICGSEREDFCSLRLRTGAQRAKKIDSGRQCELSGAQPSHKVTATDATALFQSFEHIVDGAKPTGKIFLRHRFTREDAVPMEHLLSDGVTPFRMRNR